MNRTAIITIGAILVVAAASFYYRVNPSDTVWCPKCLIYVTTGYKCPSCGVQRCLHSLLHGEFAAAVRYNYFLCVAIPYAALLFFASMSDTPRFRRVRYKLESRYACYAYLVLYFGWGVIRNIVDM